MKAELTREVEAEAFSKVLRKLDRIHPTNREDDLIVLVKMTVLDLRAFQQFWSRHSP